MEAIIIAIIASIIGPSIIAIVNNHLQNKKRPANRFDEIHDKLDELSKEQKKAEAKNDLWFLYLRYYDKDFDYDTYFRIRKTYAEYHSLGGNGEGTHIFNKLTNKYCAYAGKDVSTVTEINEKYFRETYPNWK